jgi:hypothetical protein
VRAALIATIALAALFLVALPLGEAGVGLAIIVAAFLLHRFPVKRDDFEALLLGGAVLGIVAATLYGAGASYY